MAVSRVAGGGGRKSKKSQAQEAQMLSQYESQLGATRAKKQTTRNDVMIRAIAAAPREQSDDEGKPLGRAHIGESGAPDIYREKVGGRSRYIKKRR